MITESAISVELQTVWRELDEFMQNQWARAYAQVRVERAGGGSFEETQVSSWVGGQFVGWWAVHGLVV